MGQLDNELIIDAGFADVLRRDRPVDVTELVRPGRAANDAGAGRLVCLGVRARVSALDVRRDGEPVDVQVCAVVDVLQMAPQAVSVSPRPAGATDAEVRLRARVANDEAATRQEVTSDPGAGGAAGG